jgi:hypothetical protein
MSDNLVYEAAVYSRKITYKNFKGEEKTTEVSFTLDPIQLMAVMAGYNPKKIKSGNPSLNGKDAEPTDADQIKMVRNLAMQAAGTPSEDGESWIPFEDFGDTIVGKAFLTKLVASDADRREFADKVILDPFRAFTRYFSSDASNSATEIKEMQVMLTQMEKVFATPSTENETAEERRARLEAEIASLNALSAENK